MGGALYMLLGLGVGVFSGFLGLGGGFLLVPIFIYLYGMTQHQAQGTALAVMVLPITLLAAMRYYYSGNVRVGMAVLIACGFFLGAFLGAHLAQFIHETILRRLFGFVLFLTSMRMIFAK